MDLKLLLNPNIPNKANTLPDYVAAVLPANYDYFLIKVCRLQDFITAEGYNHANAGANTVTDVYNRANVDANAGVNMDANAGVNMDANADVNAVTDV
ncbi:6541_t:CDS:2 [Cetraspora pellucida]|uniref:6541_t:CDS:1 n=1 Tax=Cetraspora pellucida TaxID=1433469 RepID=A0ACA9MPC8_9GLOM|nr:6541_t:CDS:2 [Cetraspora pellucida]